MAAAIFCRSAVGSTKCSPAIWSSKEPVCRPRLPGVSYTHRPRSRSRKRTREHAGGSSSLNSSRRAKRRSTTRSRSPVSVGLAAVTVRATTRAVAPSRRRRYRQWARDGIVHRVAKWPAARSSRPRPATVTPRPDAAWWRPRPTGAPAGRQRAAPTPLRPRRSDMGDASGPRPRGCPAAERRLPLRARQVRGVALTVRSARKTRIHRRTAVPLPQWACWKPGHAHRGVREVMPPDGTFRLPAATGSTAGAQPAPAVPRASRSAWRQRPLLRR